MCGDSSKPEQNRAVSPACAGIATRPAVSEHGLGGPRQGLSARGLRGASRSLRAMESPFVFAAAPRNARLSSGAYNQVGDVGPPTRADARSPPIRASPGCRLRDGSGMLDTRGTNSNPYPVAPSLIPVPPAYL